MNIDTLEQAVQAAADQRFDELLALVFSRLESPIPLGVSLDTINRQGKIVQEYLEVYNTTLATYIQYKLAVHRVKNTDTWRRGDSHEKLYHAKQAKENALLCLSKEIDTLLSALGYVGYDLLKCRREIILEVNQRISYSVTTGRLTTTLHGTPIDHRLHRLLLQASAYYRPV